MAPPNLWRRGGGGHWTKQNEKKINWVVEKKYIR